jgi:hypothetical protein
MGLQKKLFTEQSYFFATRRQFVLSEGEAARQKLNEMSRAQFGAAYVRSILL